MFQCIKIANQGLKKGKQAKKHIDSQYSQSTKMKQDDQARFPAAILQIKFLHLFPTFRLPTFSIFISKRFHPTPYQFFPFLICYLPFTDSYIINQVMQSSGVFMDSQTYTTSSQSLSHLRYLKQRATPQQIQHFYTQSNPHSTLLQQITQRQLHKAEACLTSNRIKIIYKQKAKAERVDLQRDDSEVKSSSRTHIQEEMEVSQYLNVEYE